MRNWEKNWKDKLKEVKDPVQIDRMSPDEVERIKKEYLLKRGDENTIEAGKFKSVYQSDAKAVFGKLNQISPSFCLAKWFNVSLHIPTGRTHSCYHPPAHYVPPGELYKQS